jgi:hypothetical protein
MPLSDGYQIEKDLSRDIQEVASAITEYFTDMGVNNRRAFILFICDVPSNTVRYISDFDRTIANQVLEHWVEQNRSEPVNREQN